MTTSVGIRELKRDGANLVRRAAGGEEIEITRYGRPAARLVAAEVGKDSAVAEAWVLERRAFERLEPRLRSRKMGRWIAVRGGKVVAEGKDAEVLSRRMLRASGEPFFIGRVGALPELVEMPGFELAR